MSRMLTFLLIGVAIGVLVAPDKGSTTRSRLAGFLSDSLDDVQDQADDFASNVKDKANDIRSGLFSKVKDANKNLKSQLD